LDHHTVIPSELTAKNRQARGELSKTVIGKFSQLGEKPGSWRFMPSKAPRASKVCKPLEKLFLIP
jgi:hypothetical protein